MNKARKSIIKQRRSDKDEEERQANKVLNEECKAQHEIQRDTLNAEKIALKLGEKIIKQKKNDERLYAVREKYEKERRKDNEGRSSQIFKEGWNVKEALPYLILPAISYDGTEKERKITRDKIVEITRVYKKAFQTAVRYNKEQIKDIDRKINLARIHREIVREYGAKHKK